MKQYFAHTRLKLKRLVTGHRKSTGVYSMSLNPVSRKFGFDRGTPIDRYYIESFLRDNRSLITGTVLEVAEDTYSRKFGSRIDKIEILHADKSNRLATIVGDLSNPQTLPKAIADCFICTQTVHVIYDFRQAIIGSRKLLKKNGVLLATLAGISQISQYDMERWGDYWRFTSKSAERAFSQVFGPDNVSVDCFGNVLSAKSFLDGLAAEELSREELDYRDPAYQLLVAIKAIKR